MQKITPFLWFDDNAEEAMNFYLSIFKDSKVGSVSRYGEAGPGPAGAFMVGTFQIEGQDFMVLNGGAHYKMTPAISFMVHCQSQEEIDNLWDQLLEGGEAMACGWLTDKFGVTWQITPTILGELLQDEDPEKAGRVMQAMMQMIKLDIPTLQKAYDGE